MDEIMIRIMRLSSQGFYCSQILLALTLEIRGGANPELLRAMAGLAYGCGAGRATCGALTGAACVLALYAGKGGLDEEESPALMPMLEELTEWFAAEAGGEGGALTCEAIMGGDAPRAPQRKCGNLVAAVFAKVMELLAGNGFDPTDSGRADDR